MNQNNFEIQNSNPKQCSKHEKFEWRKPEISRLRHFSRFDDSDLVSDFVLRNSTFQIPAGPTLSCGRGPVAVESYSRIHAFQDPLQSGQVHRLREAHVESRVVSALLIGGGEVGAHGDRGHVRRALPRLRYEVVSVPVREADVTENDIDFIVIEKSEAAGHAIPCRNGMPPGSKNCGERSLGIEMVLDEKDGTHGIKPTGSRRPLYPSIRRPNLHWSGLS
jgi:hypothetical protein